jgi:hypothetical protein
MDKNSDHKIKVIFQFVGDKVNPKVITTRLSLQPSEAHHKGDIPTKHPDRVYPSGFWGFESPLSTDLSLEEHLDYLLKILTPHTLAIKELVEIGLVPMFYCGFFSSKDTLSVNLKPEILQRIAHLNALLELHIYCDNDDD